VPIDRDRRPSGNYPHAQPRLGIVGDGWVVPAQFDDGGPLAVLVEGPADRFGGRFVNGEHRLSMGWAAAWRCKLKAAAGVMISADTVWTMQAGKSPMKWWLVAGAALALTACASNVPQPNSVQVRYEPSAREVRVLASNIRPMSDAELIAPDGSQYRTTGVVLVSGPHVLYNPPPSVGLSIGGFGFTGCCSAIGSGIGVGLPVGQPKPAAVSDQYLTSAAIPAPADYAKNWASYRLQVRIGDNTMLFNAPFPG
jgi:hypothetical protein